MARAAAQMETESARAWGAFGVAAVVSVVTMPITAVWFLLIGGVLVVAGLVQAAKRWSSNLSQLADVGLGLLVGPAIYLSLAVVL